MTEMVVFDSQCSSDKSSAGLTLLTDGVKCPDNAQVGWLDHTQSVTPADADDLVLILQNDNIVESSTDFVVVFG